MHAGVVPCFAGFSAPCDLVHCAQIVHMFLFIHELRVFHFVQELNGLHRRQGMRGDEVFIFPNQWQLEQKGEIFLWDVP